MKKLFLILFLLILTYFAYGANYFQIPKTDNIYTDKSGRLIVKLIPKPPDIQKNPGHMVKVIRVIDGDTVVIEGGRKVRYIGMNTPETVDPRKPIQCFGREASNYNKELVGGKMVRLEKDVSETDRYDRLLRYVYVDNIFVNLKLVEDGYARVSTFPPDVKYQKTIY